MRLFVAIVPPAGMRRELVRRTRRVAGGLPDCRWVPEPNLHLTLVFLGDTEQDRLAALDRELAGAFAAEPRFAARPGRPGSFPPKGPPRVLWVGLGPDGALCRLQARVADAVGRAVPGRREDRRFHPHLTVGRCRSRWPVEAVERWRRGLDGEWDEFAVDEGELVESRLGPGGARYRTVGRYPLGEAA